MAFESEIAFVTGAGSGIRPCRRDGHGAAGRICRLFTDLIGEKAAKVANDIVLEGHSATCQMLDVSDDDALGFAIDDAVRHLDRLRSDILHSLAGYQTEGGLESVSLDGMDLSWKLNVRSHFMAARAVVGHMKAQGGGSVIITSSNSGVQYDLDMIAYATTKHAVVAMTRQMAADYARYNVRFNALCPGFIDTPFNAGFEKQMGGCGELENYISRNIPMGRWGTTEEVADAVLFLASGMSSFMTGHALVIDGGETI